MLIFTMICVVIMALLMIVCYALMAIASEADYRAKKMHEEWKERQDETDRR